MEKKVRRKRKKSFENFVELLLISGGWGCIVGAFFVCFYMVVSPFI